MCGQIQDFEFEDTDKCLLCSFNAEIQFILQIYQINEKQKKFSEIQLDV